MCADEDSDALLKAVHRQAEAEKAEILSQGRAEAQEICARAEAEIKKLEAEALRQADRELVAGKDRLLGQARMDKRNSLHCAKGKVLRDVFQQAGRDILTLRDGDGYRGILLALIGEAVGALGPGACVVVAKSDKGFCEGIAEELGGDCTIKASADDPGTVIATSADGRRRTDNSLYSRLARVEALSKHDVAAVLFGREVAGGGTE